MEKKEDFGVMSEFEKMRAALDYAVSAQSSPEEARKTLKQGAPTADYLESFYTAALPEAKIATLPFSGEYKGSLAMVSGNPETQNIFLNAGVRSDILDPTTTLFHESEHVLAKKQLGSAAAYNQKFDELVGNKTDRLNVVQNLVGVQKYLQGKYNIKGEEYFNKDFLAKQHEKGMAGELLNEQFATLAAIEERYKVNLMEDPILREAVFNTAEKRQAFRAMTGLRQTRLDSKDLPPYTIIKEKEKEKAAPSRSVLDVIKSLF